MKSFRILKLEERSVVILGAAHQLVLAPLDVQCGPVVSEWEHSDADSFWWEPLSQCTLAPLPSPTSRKQGGCQ